MPDGNHHLAETVLCCVVFLSMFVGCQSPSSSPDGDQGGDQDTVQIGDQEYKVRDVRKGGKSLEITEEERRRAEKATMEQILKFRSKDPSVWKQTAEKLLNTATGFLPDIIQEKIRVAKEDSSEGKQARQQLVRWAELRKVLLRLPAEEESTWNTVRKTMLSKGGAGKQMFIQQMLRFLKKPDRNRDLAARQLARSGPDVIEHAWKHLQSQAKRARRLQQQGKKIKGVMIYLVGLSEVLIHAGEWERVETALQHRSIRVRGAMTKALALAGNPKRAIRLLGRYSISDSNPWVRTEAVDSLRALKTEQSLQHLQKALVDPRETVATSAAEALRTFHDHKKQAMRILLDALKERNDRNDQVAESIYSSLQEIADHPGIDNRYREWVAWYKEHYQNQ